MLKRCFESSPWVRDKDVNQSMVEILRLTLLVNLKQISLCFCCPDLLSYMTFSCVICKASSLSWSVLSDVQQSFGPLSLSV